MFGEIIKAGASLLGGLFGKKSTDKANEQNIKLQREFAQNGVQWKVADAKKAGISPLAALGASTASFSPSVVGDTSMGTAMASAGQDLGRAMNSTRTQDQRASAVQKSMMDLQLQGLALDNRGKEIENSLLASKLATSGQVGPSFPSADGSTNTGIPGQNNSKLTRLQLGPYLTNPAPISDAQKFEDRYGEVVSSVAGAGIAASDLIKAGIAAAQPYYQQAIKSRPYQNPRGFFGPSGSGSGSRTGRW